MNSIQTRGHVVEALREWDGAPTYTTEQRILIAAAQIIRSCTYEELMAISVTTAATGDLWGARAMADAEIARRESNAGTLSIQRGALRPADAGPQQIRNRPPRDPPKKTSGTLPDSRWGHL